MDPLLTVEIPILLFLTYSSPHYIHHSKYNFPTVLLSNHCVLLPIVIEQLHVLQPSVVFSLLVIDVCKSLDTARSSNPSPLLIIGSAHCMSYNMSYNMSYPEYLALHNLQGGGVANTFALAL